MILHDWTLFCHMDVNMSYNYLISYLEELLDLYAQCKTNVIKLTKKKLEPWMTKALIKSSKKYRKLYIKSTNSLECKNKYIKCMNVLYRLKQIRKKECFHNKISSFKGDSKRLWKFLMDTYTGKMIRITW